MPRLLAPSWLAIGLLTLAGAAAQASPFYAPPPPGDGAPTFSGEAELGYTHLSGNTDSQTLIGKSRLTWLTGDWTHTLRSEVRNVTRNGDTSAEQYLLSGRERFDFSGPHYLFGFARWEKDRFSGYDHQVTTIGGYGRQLLDTRRHRLSLEAGPGYRHDRIEEGDSEGLGVAYSALDYHWTLSRHASLRQEMSVEGTRENTTSRSLSSLTARLNSRLSMRLSHEIKHNTRPPERADARSDRTTNVTLLYTW
jgi:putative salt-induced outer membrane protein